MQTVRQREVAIGGLNVGNDRPIVLIAGPCALESRAHALEMSAALVEITRKLGVGLIYKTSFDKANRSSSSSSRGLGLSASLPILAEVRETRGCPVVTDVHEPEQCAPVAEAVEIPIILYNIPGRTAKNMEPDVVARIAEIPKLQ